MAPVMILYPMLTLVGLTLSVLGLMAHRRIAAARAGRVHPREFVLGETPAVPADVAVVNRNYMNLLENPVLFYVVCLSYFVTQQVDATAVALAWLFVALRLLHSAVHIGYNKVFHRLLAFAAANFALIALWALLLLRLG